MTGRVGMVEGRAGGGGGREGDLEGCASVPWQAADEGRLAANEREVGAEGARRQGRADRRGGKSKTEIRGRIREPAYT